MVARGFLLSLWSTSSGIDWKLEEPSVGDEEKLQKKKKNNDGVSMDKKRVSSVNNGRQTHKPVDQRPSKTKTTREKNRKGTTIP